MIPAEYHYSAQRRHTCIKHNENTNTQAHINKHQNVLTHVRKRNRPETGRDVPERISVRNRGWADKRVEKQSFSSVGCQHRLTHFLSSFSPCCMYFHSLLFFLPPLFFCVVVVSPTSSTFSFHPPSSIVVFYTPVSNISSSRPASRFRLCIFIPFLSSLFQLFISITFLLLLSLSPCSSPHHWRLLLPFPVLPLLCPTSHPSPLQHDPSCAAFIYTNLHTLNAFLYNLFTPGIHVLSDNSQETCQVP